MNKKRKRGSALIEVVIATGLGLAVVITLALMQIQQANLRRATELAAALAQSVQSEVHRLRSLPLSWYYRENTSDLQPNIVIYRPLNLQTGQILQDGSRQTKYFARIQITLEKFPDTFPNVRGPITVRVDGAIRFLQSDLPRTRTGCLVMSETDFTTNSNAGASMPLTTEKVTFVAL